MHLIFTALRTVRKKNLSDGVSRPPVGRKEGQGQRLIYKSGGLMEVPGGLMVIAPETGDYQFIPYASIDKLRWKVKHCHMGCPAIGYFIVADTKEGERHMLAGYVQRERAPQMTSGDFLFMTEDPLRDAKARMTRLLGSVRSVGGALVARG